MTYKAWIGANGFFVPFFLPLFDFFVFFTFLALEGLASFRSPVLVPSVLAATAPSGLTATPFSETGSVGAAC